MKGPHSHQLTAEVKLLQKAVVVQGGKALILKRSADSGSRAEKWDLPGGNTEWPDSLQDVRNPHLHDVVREVFEETGIELALSAVSDCVYVGSYFEPGKQIYTIILGWSITLPSGVVQQDILLSDEHTAFAWIGLSEFDQYDFGFAGDQNGFIRLMMEKALKR